MKRYAFTLVELLIVVAILGIVLALIVGAIGRGCSKDPDSGESYYDTQNTAVFQCVKTYTMNVDEDTTSKRVDLRPADGGQITTMCCDDDYWAGIRNSATLYAQFEPDKWYTVTYIGFRKEGYIARFPLVKAVSPAEDPTIQQMENPITEVPAEANEDSFVP